MRASLLAPGLLATVTTAGLLLSSSALAGGLPVPTDLNRQSEDAILEFQGIEPVLDASNGLEIVLGPSELNVTVGAAPQGQLGILVEGISRVWWEGDTEDTLKQTIQPLPNGGNVVFDGDVELYVDVSVLGSAFPLFGLTLPFQNASEGFGSFVFTQDGDDPLDLAISSNQLSFSESFGLADLLALAIGVNIGSFADAGVTVWGNPTSTVLATGRHLDTTIDDEVYRLENSSSFVPVFLDGPQDAVLGETVYEMQTQTVMGYEVGADLYLEVLFGTIDVDIELWGQEIPLFQSYTTVNYESGEFEHPLPMADLSSESVTFGELNIGSSDVVEVVVSNDGKLELQGALTLTGSEDFTVSPSELYIAPGASQSLLITFAPTAEGEHFGFITLETNDPTMPFTEIAISANGYTGDAPDDVDGEVTGTDNGLYEVPERSSIIYGGCGCSSSNPAAGTTLGWVGLVGGLVLARRRRREG